MAERRETSMIIVHHSAGLNGNAQIFRDFHVHQRGWEDIGYHFVICNGHGGGDGEIETGRAENLVGAHAGNPHPSRNRFSVGICLVGENIFTPEQLKSLKAKLIELCRKYHIVPSAQTIQRHHPDCPGTGLNLEAIIAQVQKEL
ncbi:MAG: N-acetylmuramoyl-L-alanine amidase [Candidatus Pacebacteria bacterium]|nr:N-acetylmuramoyl-L-alanine amidase [Candidatus Paceibacterota bacterium]